MSLYTMNDDYKRDDYKRNHKLRPFADVMVNGFAEEFQKILDNYPGVQISRTGDTIRIYYEINEGTPGKPYYITLSAKEINKKEIKLVRADMPAEHPPC
jgi:hypothetical protein